MTELVGLLPAAGKASRLGILPCSKEILPIDVIDSPAAPGDARLITAIDHSLLAFEDAGIHTAFIVISADKDDIKRYLAQSPVAQVEIVFDVIADSPSIVCSLAKPYAKYREKNVALLFPDIIFEPRHLLTDMQQALNSGHADIVLGLMPTDRGDKMDIVETGRHGEVISIRPKPGAGIRGDTWIAAVWTPRFSAYLAQEAKGLIGRPADPRLIEVHIGDVVQAAIEDGMSVLCERFADGTCHDLGTLPEYRAHWRDR